MYNIRHPILLILPLLVALSGACTKTVEPDANQNKDGQSHSDKRSSRPSSAIYNDQINAPKDIAPPAVLLGDDPRLGKRDAKIGLVEFSDYQCHYCQHFHQAILPKFKEVYIDTGLAQYIIKDFPLKTHQHSLSASLAANCAGAQGQYWAMQDGLFENQGQLGANLYQQLARQLKLDNKRFSACMQNRLQQHEVFDDINYGRGLGVKGTPTFFLGIINGDTLEVKRMARGAPSFESLKQEIEKLQP